MTAAATTGEHFCPQWAHTPPPMRHIKATRERAAVGMRRRPWAEPLGVWVAGAGVCVHASITSLQVFDLCTDLTSSGLQRR